MTALVPRELLPDLNLIETIALLRRVSSTNDLGRRIIEEYIENDVELPGALLIAREQTAGRGRGNRGWHSPAGAGIYASMLLSRTLDRLGTLPLEIAVAIANFLKQRFGLDAQIKWPNDILVHGRKIAGILIEARTHNQNAYTVIGMGINVAPVSAELAPAATSIAESSASGHADLDDVTEAFIRALDAALASPPDDVITEWTRLTVHRPGDEISFRLGKTMVQGAWEGIDTFGRALIRQGSEVREVSAADLVMITTPPA